MKLRNYTLVALPLFILHTLEEYYFNFINTDKSIGWLADILNISRAGAYWTVQILLFAFLLWLLFHRPANKFWSIVLGIIFAVELSHLWKALVSGSYAPGFWTAIPLVVLGVLFWKELLMKKHDN